MAISLDTATVMAHARDVGFDMAGVAPLRASDHAAFYQRWLDAGHHGDMHYLARADAVARRLDPAAAWPQLMSAIVVALNYNTDDVDDDVAHDSSDDVAAPGEADASRGIIARYARGRDYHKVIKQKLLQLLERIERDVGHELSAARAYVDTGPVLERELAQRAGLGWFGRNTMLIHPRRGSYFFLGTLLVELELEPDAPFAADHCGTCNACVDACPTGALLGRNADGAPVIDATRCISYLTIEQRGPIPRELRPLIGNRVFGCDICQEVCPWNSSKFVQITGEADFDGRERDRERLRRRLRDQRDPLPGATLPSLIALMRMTHEEWDEWTRGSAIRRSGYAGLRRNVAVALGNWGAEEAVGVLEEALSDPEPLVRSHSVWALGQIDSESARSVLASGVGHEGDDSVRAELQAARWPTRDPRRKAQVRGPDQ